MRGKYHMMEWEQEKWKQEFSGIITRLGYNQRHIEDLTNLDLCPANVVKTLENLGWTEEEMDSNGWENDTLYWFSHPDYKFDLVFHYEGYTFEMRLYRKDIDD